MLHQFKGNSKEHTNTEVIRKAQVNAENAKLVNIRGAIINCILTMDKNHLHCSRCSITYSIAYWLKDNERGRHAPPPKPDDPGGAG